VISASGVHAQAGNGDPQAPTGIEAPTSDWDPYVCCVIINPAPLLPVEFNGTGVGYLNPGIQSGFDLPLGSPTNPNDRMTVVATLVNGAPNVANPQDPTNALTALGGPGVIYWDWTYTPATRTYRGVQNRVIPAFTAEEITIQYKLTDNTFSGNAFNGLNVNIQLPGYTNPQPADNDKASSYTYVEAKDYGDAPISYGDVSHTIDVSKEFANDPATYNRYFVLGTAVDPESAYQASATAAGDDINQTGGLGLDDENGVTFPPLTQGQPAVIPVVATIVDEGFEAVTPRLSAWIDWNGDGDFLDPGERIATNLSVTASGIVSLNITVPATAVTGPTFARFRFGPSVTGPTGLASYGEVEDYMIIINSPTAVTLRELVARPAGTLQVWDGLQAVLRNLQAR